MASTPPSSGGLFFPSSSPAQASTSLAEEVESIVAQALRHDWLDPTLKAVIISNQDAFFSTFRQRVELIKSRSQAFQDCHITVFDKALLELTQNGHNLKSPSAIVFFCEEHLGISPSAGARRQQALADALTAPEVLKQVPIVPNLQSRSASTNVTCSLSPEKKRLIKTRMEEQKPAIFAALAAKVDSLALRLWTIYERAKDEFDAIGEPNSIEKQDAAKFLRDTAENTLHYLSDKSPNHRLVDDLEMTLAVAKHTAMTLHGGKKRKFDDPVPFRDRSRLLIRPSSQFDTVNTDQGSERHERHARARTSERRYQGDLFNGHDRVSRWRDRSDDEEFASHKPSFVAPELSPRSVDAPKRKKQQPGRGHSGIPYGYSRPVDSYHPN